MISPAKSDTYRPTLWRDAFKTHFFSAPNIAKTAIQPTTALDTNIKPFSAFAVGTNERFANALLDA